jgi:hypothetical protein
LGTRDRLLCGSGIADQAGALGGEALVADALELILLKVFGLQMREQSWDRISLDESHSAPAKATTSHSAPKHTWHLKSKVDQSVQLLTAHLGMGSPETEGEMLTDLIIVLQRAVALCHQLTDSREVAVLESIDSGECPNIFRHTMQSAAIDQRIEFRLHTL